MSDETATTQTRRDRARDRLASGPFDLLVIGGGAIGLATAWLGAREGLRVALVEAGDFAGATSSASSKLVHGGLRYLALGDISLVREAHHERLALGQTIAPHLVRPLPFLMPLYEGGPHSPQKIRAGVFLYSALSRFRDGRGRIVRADEARRRVPALRTESLRGCGLYGDHQTNDSRLALAIHRAALDAGAVALNYAAVEDLRTTGDRVAGVEVRDRISGEAFAVEGRVVVNATGPWVDRLRKLEDPAQGTSVRLSKGTHVVLKALDEWHSALTTPVDDVRVSFAIPWEGNLLLGTTDDSYEGDPGDVAPSPAEIDQILREASTSVEPEQLNRDLLRYSFSGLRVLPGGPGDVKNAKREVSVTQGTKQMWSVAGGKWTTFRQIGWSVLEHMRRDLGLTRIDRTDSPLPGAADPDAVARELVRVGDGLDADVARHLAGHYGYLAHRVLAAGGGDSSLMERIHPDGPDIWAQVAYARDEESAVTAEDVLRRRATVMIRGLDTAEVVARTEAILGVTGGPSGGTGDHMAAPAGATA